MAIHRIPELYADNLNTLKRVLDALEQLTKIEGLFAAEIRVKVDDVESWAVIGWGEAGDPCILRFEDDVQKPDPLPQLPSGIGPNVWTINKETKHFGQSDLTE